MELATDIVEKKKFTSGKGAEYEVGYAAPVETNDLDTQSKEGGAVAAGCLPSYITVYWTVGSREFIDTTPEVLKATGIAKYYLARDQVIPSQFELAFKFKCIDLWPCRNYVFYLKNGDTLQVTSKKHFGEIHIYFRSDSDPTIIAISNT